MKRSVDEKLKYNSEQKTPFAYGYRFGVKAYREYPKANKKQYAKGFMCAMRDCAAERKVRQKR